jgi:general secretion pathway protein A
LSEAETRNYINHRLKIAGAKRELFTADAVRDIFLFSAGYPRLINIICDHALLTGYAAGLKSINKRIIQECVRELQIPIDQGLDSAGGGRENKALPAEAAASLRNKPSYIMRIGVAALIGFLVLSGIYFFAGQKSGNEPRWSMEEIAPQQYKGPSPQEMKDGHNAGVQVSEPKEVVTNEDPPLSDGPLNEPIASSAKEYASTTENPRPADENAAEIQVQQPALPAENQGKTVTGEIQAAPPLPEGKIFIYFKHNSNELPDQAYEMLNRVADIMLNRPTATIDIKGYTDSTGSRAYNESVSEFRANTIKIFLVGKGVDPSKIKTAGLGPANPIASNKTEEGRRRNRRVELEVKGK